MQLSANRFSDLLDVAKAEGFSSALIPDGPYRAEIVTANTSKNQKGQSTFGLRFKILDGPNAGESTWENLTLMTDNAKALGFFFGFLKRFGLDDEFLKTDPTDEEIASRFLGQVADITIGHRSYVSKGGEVTKNTVKVDRVDPRGSVTSVDGNTASAAGWLN